MEPRKDGEHRKDDAGLGTALRRLPHSVERLLRHVGIGGGVVAPCAARADGGGRRAWRAGCHPPARRSDAIPFNGSGRHHSCRRAGRRLFGRDARRPAWRRALRPARNLGLSGVGRHRRRRDHLFLARRRRADTKTYCAQQPGTDRRAGRAVHGCARHRRNAGGLAPEVLHGVADPAAARAQDACKHRHRGGGEEPHRRGHAERRLPCGRARHDRRGASPGRPLGAQRDDAAHRGGVGRSRRFAAGDSEADRRKWALALPRRSARPGRARRHRPHQGPARSGGAHGQLRSRHIAAAAARRARRHAGAKAPGDVPRERRPHGGGGR